MKIEKVYVATVFPNDTKLASYIYGVFNDDHFAHEHFEKYGDKNSTLLVVSAQYVKQNWFDDPERNK